jgi:3-hydroxyacyl-CoA dehydrogenase/enoyl-CoA hydratase/3-hydroxybutyryl-CoA epimerase
MGEAHEEGPAEAALAWMVREEGRLGRKNKAGFYAYDEKGKRLGLWDGLARRYPWASAQPAVEEVKDRLLMVQALEAVRALEEGVLGDIREGDVGAILGWGFAPWSGGPFSWLDMQGAAAAAERCARLAERHGARFEAPKLLVEMAGRGERFYARFAPETDRAA